MSDKDRELPGPFDGWRSKKGDQWGRKFDKPGKGKPACGLVLLLVAAAVWGFAAGMAHAIGVLS